MDKYVVYAYVRGNKSTLFPVLLEKCIDFPAAERWKEYWSVKFDDVFISDIYDWQRYISNDYLRVN